MIRPQAIGAGLVLGIVVGISINAYNLSHPETFQSHFVYEAEAKAPEVVQIATEIEWTPKRIEREIEEQAEKYGRDAKLMKALIECESMGSTTIQSYHIQKDGVREPSFGLAQIHLGYHPTVTHAEAIDPEFAIEFMAKNLGKVKWWCEDMI